MSDLLDRVPLLPALRHVNVISNKLTYFVMPKMLSFIKNLDKTRAFTLEMTPRDIHPKEKDVFIHTVKKAVADREKSGAAKFRLVFI